MLLINFNRKFNRKHKMYSTAQSSVEFVILTGFMLVAFLVFYIVIQSRLVEANRDSTDIAAKQVETIVVNELKIAESVSDGYYREFEIPPKVNGLEYNISIIPGLGGTTPEIVIRYNNKERVYFILQSYISSTSTIGIGTNTISKNNGIILLTYTP